jgi:hypothetical protein
VHGRLHRLLGEDAVEQLDAVIFGEDARGEHPQHLVCGEGTDREDRRR